MKLTKREFLRKNDGIYESLTGKDKPKPNYLVKVEGDLYQGESIVFSNLLESDGLTAQFITFYWASLNESPAMIKKTVRFTIKPAGYFPSREVQNEEIISPEWPLAGLHSAQISA